MQNKNITLASLKKTHGAEAENIFQQIASVGGFGDVPMDYQGGLDVSGLSADKKKEVESLLSAKPGKS